MPLGINTPANDMLWYHDQSPTGQNVWWQFMGARGDIAPGAGMIEILKRRIAAGVENEERLNFYFTPAVPGVGAAGFFGYRPGGSTNLQTAPRGSITAMDAPGTAPAAYSAFNFIDNATDPGDVRMPVITYAETQLIGAEAAFQTGGQGAAQPFLDAAAGQPLVRSERRHTVVFTPLAPVPATLENIMEEKYVTLFLNIEAWNDYKRTCLPALAPALASFGNTTPGTQPIPGRLPMGSAKPTPTRTRRTSRLRARTPTIPTPVRCWIMRLRHRWEIEGRILLLCAALNLAACYTYRPLETTQPEAGSRVSAQLTNSGSQELIAEIGPDVLHVEGMVLHADSAGLDLEVKEIESYRGIRSDWNGEQVRLPREAVAGLQERRLSPGGTGLMGGAIVAGLLCHLSRTGRGGALRRQSGTERRRCEVTAGRAGKTGRMGQMGKTGRAGRQSGRGIVPYANWASMF